MPVLPNHGTQQPKYIFITTVLSKRPSPASKFDGKPRLSLSQLQLLFFVYFTSLYYLCALLSVSFYFPLSMSIIHLSFLIPSIPCLGPSFDPCLHSDHHLSFSASRPPSPHHHPYHVSLLFFHHYPSLLQPTIPTYSFLAPPLLSLPSSICLPLLCQFFCQRWRIFVSQVIVIV